MSPRRAPEPKLVIVARGRQDLLDGLINRFGQDASAEVLVDRRRTSQPRSGPDRRLNEPEVSEKLAAEGYAIVPRRSARG